MFAALLKKLFIPLLAIVGALVAPVALAMDNIGIGGNNTWDLYVYGNGDALAQILTSVKLMLKSKGFHMLLLTLALVGFVILAVRAGFDPGKNLTKMFGFLILIVFVRYSTLDAGARIHIYDRFAADPGKQHLFVDGAPALVAIPAALTSQVGEWMTRSIEQYFSIPEELKVSGGGYFNIFGKVFSDANQFVLTDAELKRSLTAYVSDCVVPSMAMGSISGDELLTSPNLMETLKRAQHGALMTRYYPMRRERSAAIEDGLAEATPSPLGTLMSCKDAYARLEPAVETYAEELMDATAAQWASTGTMAPFETVMSKALEEAGASGGSARYSRPQGLILQKALTGSMSGAFRNAAVRTGNNEMITATSLAQAEHSQKSAWAAAGEVFQNLMGYVYLVLQAFIFAVVPIVVIALMIPGLGGKIFGNYVQILVWLMLWSPTLAIVNFLITTYGKGQLSSSIGTNGLTMGNSALITEQTNNLVVAAQFIGTMVPMITWGLVKGGMAFTEFISAGVGSSFSNQAGASAATGNMSMGNLSMDNVGMNKYSTVMSSQVGAQQVQGESSVGNGLTTHGQGGAVETGHGQNQNRSVGRSDGWKFTTSDGQSVSVSKQTGQDMQRASQQAYTESESWAERLATANSQLDAYMKSESARESGSTQQALEAAQKVSEASEMSRTATASVGMDAKASFSLNPAKWGGSVEVSGRTAVQKNNAEKLVQSAEQAVKDLYSRSHDTSIGNDHSAQSSTQNSSALEKQVSNQISQNYSAIESVKDSIATGSSIATGVTLTRDTSVATSQSIGMGTTGDRFSNMDDSAIDAGRAHVEQARAQMEGDLSAANIGGFSESVDSAISSGRAGVTASGADLQEVGAATSDYDFQGDRARMENNFDSRQGVQAADNDLSARALDDASIFNLARSPVEHKRMMEQSERTEDPIPSLKFH